MKGSLKACVGMSAALLLACRTTAPRTAPAFTDRLNYRGFVVDLSAIRASADRDTLAQAIRTQFDLIANLPLRNDLQQFFRSIPFVVDSAAFADPQYRGSPAGYCNGSGCPLAREGGRIKIVPRAFANNNAIFLHELLHAYHNRRLPEGYDNPDVLRLYQSARATRSWGDSVYAMRNPQEYFASLGSLFFYGRAGTDGLITRDTIKRRDPALYELLANEFEPRQ
jgi:hypothetical protein